MTPSHRLVFQVTCLVLLIVFDNPMTVDGAKYCDDEFSMALYRVCAEHKRSGGADQMGFQDLLSLSGVRNRLKKRSAGFAFKDDAGDDGTADFARNMQKREDVRGLAYHCCTHGCTAADIERAC